MGRLFLGIDVSTTGAKALLVDEKGTVVAAATTPLTLSTPRPLWSEQDPHEWWSGVTRSIPAALAQAKVGGGDVAAVGLTGQMHGLVLLDDDQRVLRPAILWNDQRTGAQCDEIRARMGGRARLVQVTGNDALTGFTAPKILWVRENEPEVYARARRVLLPKDYVRLRLTGEAAMDKADGSGTLLFDLAARDWSAEVLRALDVPRAWLPPTHEGPEVTGRITAASAAATGLREGTPVMAGGGDQAAGAVGAGAITPGVVSLTLGTSGVVFATTDTPLVEPEGRLHAFCHAVPGRWHLMGVTLSAAGSLQWYRDTLAPGESFEALVAEAASAPAGSEGLIFLPYLSGERTPYPDPLARGAFVGLTVRHRRAHLTRAVLEGVAFSMKDCMGLFAQAGLASVKQVRVAGGGARSVLWRKILASVLGAELVTVNSTEGAAYGAALLAGVGTGAWKDVASACGSAIAVTGRDEPDSRWQSAYDALYPRYRAMYPALKPEFAALGGSASA
ncbi:MAG TPA: xylulokinase [Vicinamibacteria bacterium]|nr:xylulokinase [Vicinamibacteria bacterium]